MGADGIQEIGHTKATLYWTDPDMEMIRNKTVRTTKHDSAPRKTFSYLFIYFPAFLFYFFR
jgi:hypothetical protein